MFLLNNYLISDEVKHSFDKKSNKPRSKSEVRDKKEEKIRNVETQTGDERSGSAGLCYYVSCYYVPSTIKFVNNDRPNAMYRL